jgi:kinesin family protein 5
MDLIRFGYKDRKIAATYNNDCSSRSHTILFLYRLHRCHDREYRTKLCFIDLAGSEKIRKSGVKGQTLEETKKINLSLSCLGNVVSALTTAADHVPYRNSKLTRILKDSLSGGCRTSIITTCSLDRNDVHETLSTIKFAVRAKRIRNKRRLANHQDTPEEIIASLKRELAITKKELELYKKKEEKTEDVPQTEEIPEEAVVSRPIKLSTFSGAGLRTKHFSSTTFD